MTLQMFGQTSKMAFQNSRILRERILKSTSTTFIKSIKALSSVAQVSDIYELRTYSIQPNKMQEYLVITKEKFDLRTSQSKLLGFWTTEIGGLNQVVHLWPYESLIHRAAVRANLAKSPQWQSQYISRVVPMFASQDNMLLTSIPDFSWNQSKNSGAYELQVYQMKDASSSWSEDLHKFLTSGTASADFSASPSSLFGVWQSVIGPLNSVVMIWQHQSPQNIITLQDELENSHDYKGFTRHQASRYNKMLMPFVVPLWS